MRDFFIGERLISNENSFLIAEIAQAHDGSLGIAHSYIDAVAEAGADAIKFQTHFADEESSQFEPWRKKFSFKNETRFEYWKRMEFSEEEWFGLWEHAKQKNLIFLSSPFSFKAIDLLEKMGIPAWKIASGEINNPAFLNRLSDTKKPVLISTGMSNYQEVSSAVEHFNSKDINYCVLQCSSNYPTPPEKLGLNIIKKYTELFDCHVGLSDHSGSIFPSIAALAMGARVFELHVTFDKRLFGPDTSSSITIDELSQLAQGLKIIQTGLNHEVDKDDEAKNLSEYKQIFGKSLFAATNLEAGDVVSLEKIKLKKPGTGILAKDLETILGKTLKADILEGEMFQKIHFE